MRRLLCVAVAFASSGLFPSASPTLVINDATETAYERGLEACSNTGFKSHCASSSMLCCLEKSSQP